MSAIRREFGLALVLALAVVFVSSCTTRQADFTVMTNRLVKLDRVDLDSLPRKERVKGEETKLVQLMLIPFPLSTYPTIEGAMGRRADERRRRPHHRCRSQRDEHFVHTRRYSDRDRGGRRRENTDIGVKQ